VPKVTKKELTDAMAKYGYIIPFKEKGKIKKVKDMRAVGYLYLAHKHGLEEVHSELLHYSHDGKTIRAVVKVVVYFDGNGFSAISDMDDRSQSVRSPDMVVRVCETAALKRAISRALFIDRDALQQFEIGKAEAEEEEAYTPAPTKPAEPEPAEPKEITDEEAKKLEKEIEELAEEFEEEW